MVLGAILVFCLARTLAHPVQPTPTDVRLDPGTSSLSVSLPPIAIVSGAAGCIQDPKTVRTLWNIVYGCLGTIGLCTYVSVHPNIPDRRASLVEKTWKKLVTTFCALMACALMAPELVVVWAMRQRIVASKVEKNYHAHQWTKTHGFFIQMGGFILEDQDTFKVVTIDENGLACITRNTGEDPQPFTGVLPVISEEELHDKSKGDWFTKLLAVVQTTWFILRCVARRVEGLTLTELELITLAFAVLNIFTYTLWWSKPMNAGYPIYFKMSGERSYGPSFNSERGWGSLEVYHAIGSGFEWGARISRIRRKVRAAKEEIAESPAFALIYLICGLFLLYCAVVFGGPALVASAVLFGTIRINQQFVALTGLIELPSHYPTSVGAYYSGRLTSGESVIMIWGLSLVGLLFGGIHLIGWNFEFLSETERTLWRMSSINITIIPVIIPLANWIGRNISRIKRELGDSASPLERKSSNDIELMDTAANPTTSATPTQDTQDTQDTQEKPSQSLLSSLSIRIARVVIATLVVILPIITGLGAWTYTPTRLVLLALALVSLRNLPPSAYTEVPWSNYIPHIS
ncbi:hypothetical protein AX16_004638 [Volvariella volvacea WC 439]|nr:hypothetical protein AX16_004638 [Volvariella volvacea WC 439]